MFELEVGPDVRRVVGRVLALGAGEIVHFL